MRIYLILIVLTIASCKPSTEKDAAATDQPEVNTTSAVQEEPVFESATDEKLAMMQGTWYSTEDPKSYLQVTDDHLLMGYEGVENATDTYAVTIADQLPDDQPSDADTQYLILEQGEETMTYAIDELTKNTLRLLYLPRGNFLNFTKKQD